MHGPLIAPSPPADSLWARARADDPAPSHRAAAEMNRRGIVRGHAHMIELAVQDDPGANTAQIAKACGLTVVQVDRRGADMERAGLVHRKGEYEGFSRWWVGREEAAHD